MAPKLFGQGTATDIKESKRALAAIGAIFSGIMMAVPVPFLPFLGLAVSDSGSPYDYLIFLMPLAWEILWISLLVIFIKTYQKNK